MLNPAPSVSRAPGAVVVADSFSAADKALVKLQGQIGAVRHGDAATQAHRTAIAANEAIEAGLVGFTHVFADRVDFSGGVWSDRAGQSDAAQAARLLARTGSTVSDLASQLGVISNATDKAGAVPTYNDLGKGGTSFTDYWNPAIIRAREDIAVARAALDDAPTGA